ncbi:hypothetical protein FOZ61_008058 [Perkinsus olseni]|uniref:Uncharacterized protein n=1 Tax=Perkinsus olseni TaxID=32597 RepID=A0A7J6LFS6_PEROL|nr:hypothetical protein FOZ61_008058 [Perkinsus olseni]KAF4657781.1 hypothetical protein FOL46_007273 [Perkinsus olseni]
MKGPTKRRNVSTEGGNEKKRPRTKVRGPGRGSGPAESDAQQRRGLKSSSRLRKQLAKGSAGQQQTQPQTREPTTGTAPPSTAGGGEDEEALREKFDRLMKDLDRTYNNAEYSRCIKAANALLKLPSYILNQDWGTREWGGALERYDPGYRVLDGIRETMIVCHTESRQNRSAVKICGKVIADKKVPACTKAWAVTQKVDCLLNAGLICEAYTFALKQDDDGVRDCNDVYLALQKCFPWFVGLARIKWAFRELQGAARNAREALQIAGKGLDREPASWVLWCYLIIAEAASELKPTRSNLRQALKWWKKAIDMDRVERRAGSSTATTSICRIRCIVWLSSILEAYGTEIGKEMASYLTARLRGLRDELTAEFNAMSEVASDDCVLELHEAKLLLCRLEGETAVKEQKRTVVIDCSSGGVAKYLTRSLTPNCTWVYQSPAGDPGMRLGLKALVALQPIKARDELTVYRLPSTSSVAAKPRKGRKKRGGTDEGDSAPRLGFGEVYEDLTDSYGHAALLHGYLHNHGEVHRSPVFDTDAVQIVAMPVERVAKEGPFRVLAARDVAVGERIFMCDGIIRALSPGQLGQADPATVIPLRDLPKGAFGFWVNPKTMKYIDVQGELPDLRNSKNARNTKPSPSPMVDVESLKDITHVFGLSSKLTALILSRLRDPSHYGALTKLFNGLYRLPRNEAFNRAAWKLAERHRLCEPQGQRRRGENTGETSDSMSTLMYSPDEDDYFPSEVSPETAARQAVFSEDQDHMAEAIRLLRRCCISSSSSSSSAG